MVENDDFLKSFFEVIFGTQKYDLGFCSENFPVADFSVLLLPLAPALP